MLHLRPGGGRSRRVRALTAALLLVAGCGKRTPEAGGGAADGGGAPQRGGTVVVALGSEPQALMPYGAPLSQNTNVMSLIFMALAATDTTLVDFTPSLARSWTWSPDSLHLTMFLRDDVRWTDGEPVTAEDVRFSWEIARDPGVAWSTRSWKEPVRDCVIVDRFTVRYDFDEIFPDQFRFAKEGFVIPRHLLQDVPRERWNDAAFGRNPIGCGPFRLERWEPQQRIVLARNDDYCDEGKPYLDRIVFEIVPDDASRVAQLRAGRLDLVEDMALRDAAALRQEEAGGSPWRILSCRGRFYDYIGYNRRDPLFASRRVREALTRAIDRRTIIERHCYGFAEPIESPFVPIQWAYDPSRPITPYDVDGARRLLEAEGWRDRDGDGWLDRDGTRFEFSVIVANDNQQRVDALLAVQNDWRKIGVKAEVQTLERQAARDLREQKRFQACLAGWQVGLTSNLRNIWGCDRIEEGLNYVSFCDPRVDSLNARAIRLPVDRARPLFREAQRLVAEDYPYTWMYYAHQVVALNRRVQGAIIDLRGAYNNPEAWWVTDAERAAR